MKLHIGVENDKKSELLVLVFFYVYVSIIPLCAVLIFWLSFSCLVVTQNKSTKGLWRCCFCCRLLTCFDYFSKQMEKKMHVNSIIIQDTKKNILIHLHFNGEGKSTNLMRRPCWKFILGRQRHSIQYYYIKLVTSIICYSTTTSEKDLTWFFVFVFSFFLFFFPSVSPTAWYW